MSNLIFRSHYLEKKLERSKYTAHEILISLMAVTLPHSSMYSIFIELQSVRFVCGLGVTERADYPHSNGAVAKDRLSDKVSIRYTSVCVCGGG